MFVKFLTVFVYLAASGCELNSGRCITMLQVFWGHLDMTDR